MYNTINKLDFKTFKAHQNLRNCVVEINIIAYEWDTVVAMGIKPVLDRLVLGFTRDFFEKNFEASIKQVRQVYGDELVKVEQWRELHSLGYLPLEIRAFSDGANIKDGLTIAEVANTVDGYGWLAWLVAELFKTEYYKWCLDATMARDYVYEVNKAFKRTSSSGEPAEYIGFVGNLNDENDIRKSICWSIYSNNSNIEMTGAYAIDLFGGTGVECKPANKEPIHLNCNVAKQTLYAIKNLPKDDGTKNVAEYTEFEKTFIPMIRTNATVEDVKDIYTTMREAGYAANCAVLQITSENFEFMSAGDGKKYPCSKYLAFSTNPQYAEFNNGEVVGNCRIYAETVDGDLEYNNVDFKDREDTRNIMHRKLYNGVVSSLYGFDFEGIRGLANKLLKNTLENINY